MVFCYKCGKEVADNVDFCQYCGTNLSKEISNETEKIRKQPKSQFIALLLCLTLGMIGVHDFYLERNGAAITKLLIIVFLGWITVGIVINGIWCIIDFLVILSKGYNNLLTDEEFERLNKHGI